MFSTATRRARRGGPRRGAGSRGWRMGAARSRAGAAEIQQRGGHQSATGWWDRLVKEHGVRSIPHERNGLLE